MLKENFFTQKILLSFIVVFLLNDNKLSNAQQMKLKAINESELNNDSYRLSLDLNEPRRYATKFDKETRILHIKIIPARADELKSSSLYDTRYIQRIVLKEKDSEVEMDIQLKNFPIAWMVASQENPWRIIVDFWRTEQEKISLNDEWNWQPNYIAGFAGDKIEEGLPAIEIAVV